MYMTINEFYEGVECGAYGPDEDCRWVSINDAGDLIEEPVVHPRRNIPVRVVAVRYYGA